MAQQNGFWERNGYNGDGRSNGRNGAAPHHFQAGHNGHPNGNGNGNSRTTNGLNGYTVQQQYLSVPDTVDTAKRPWEQWQDFANRVLTPMEQRSGLRIKYKDAAIIEIGLRLAAQLHSPDDIKRIAALAEERVESAPETWRQNMRRLRAEAYMMLGWEHAYDILSQGLSPEQRTLIQAQAALQNALYTKDATRFINQARTHLRTVAENNPVKALLTDIAHSINNSNYQISTRIEDEEHLKDLSQSGVIGGWGIAVLLGLKALQRNAKRGHFNAQAGEAIGQQLLRLTRELHLPLKPLLWTAEKLVTERGVTSLWKNLTETASQYNDRDGAFAYAPKLTPILYRNPKEPGSDGLPFGTGGVPIGYVVGRSSPVDRAAACSVKARVN